MPICAKHDVPFPDGGECWNCEETKLNATPGAKEKAYRDPQFLKKRGGLDAAAAVRSQALDKLSSLTPEQMDKLIALAGGQVPASSSPGPSRVIA